MTEQLHDLLQGLPASNLTTRLLGLLDKVVPGEWQNVTSFEGMIKLVTGEEDQSLLQQVGEKAIALYKDPTQGYQRAISVFQLVDNAQGVAGFAALANKFSFLEGITPKSDVTQAIDAGIKLVAEMTTFCLVNGIPGDSIGDFARSFVNGEKEDRMRLAAWVAYDGLLPLGPDFLARIIAGVKSLTTDQLSGNGRFARIAAFLPGGVAEKKKLLEGTLEAARSGVTSFVADRGLTQTSILDQVTAIVKVNDNRLDYLAAALDLSTNYFEHTGIQSVARRVISRAYGEI
jgi:hypothetical protein